MKGFFKDNGRNRHLAQYWGIGERKMRRIAMILRRSPYGDINAPEAVRHAMGGAAAELSIDLILVNDGVLLAKKDHDDTGTGFTNLESALKDAIYIGVEGYADKASLSEHYLESTDTADVVRTARAKKIKELIQDARITLDILKN